MLQKGNKKTIRAWAMYDWANSAYSLTITSAIFPAFYNALTSEKNATGEVVRDYVFERYGLSNTSLYAWAIALGFLIVAALAPILSGIADFSDSKKKFMQFFCYLGSAACMSLFFFDWTPDASSQVFYWVGIIGMVLACVGWSGGNIFYNAYLPEIAEPKDHDRISALGFALGYIGSVLLLVWNLTMLLEGTSGWYDSTLLSHELWGVAEADWTEGRKTKAASQIACLSVGIWWLVFAQYSFKHLPSKSHNKKPKGSLLKNGYKELRKVLKELKGQVRLKRYLVAFFMFNLAVQTTMYMAATFAADEIKSIDEYGNVTEFNTENLIITILLIQLVAIPGAFLFSYLSKKLGNVRALIIALCIWILIVYGAYRVEYQNSFYMLACAVGMVMGGVQALARSTYSKMLPETTDNASYFSFYNMLYYLGVVVGTFGFGFVDTITGDIRNSILVIGSSFVIGLLLLLRVPKLQPESSQT